MKEPAIAETLRKYLRAVGARPNPVRVTEPQMKSLEDAGLTGRDTTGAWRFEGQLIAIHKDSWGRTPEPVHALAGDSPLASRDPRAMNNYIHARPCKHQFCRSLRANELADMGLDLHEIAEAMDTQYQVVRCRLPDSAPRAPVT